MAKIDQLPFAFLDVEAWSWNRFRCAAFVTEHGEVTVFRNREAMRRHVENFHGRVWSHMGGGYDFLFLQPGLQNVCVPDSLILRAQFGRALLHDSWRLMACRLALIGEAVGLPKLEGISDQMDAISDDQAIAGATRDCEIGVFAIRAFKEWLSQAGPWDKLPTTSGTTAIHLMKVLEPDHVKHLSKHVLDPAVLEEMAQVTTGGRSELFHLGMVEQLWAYDLNSSYPYSWMEGPIPCGPFRRVRSECKDAGVFWCSEIRQNRNLLPLVAVSHSWQYDGKGWLTSEEIAAVREHGGSVKVDYGWASAAEMKLGQRFVKWLYPFKEQTPALPWAKGALVALHGKFVQGCEQETFVDAGKGYERDQTLSLPSWYQQPIIAAFVYGRARLRLGIMGNKLRAAGWRVFYMADDCLHTDCPPKQFPGVIGFGIGEWKVAADGVEGCYIAPKFYGLRDDKGRVRVACRGFDPEVVTWDHLVTAAQGAEVELHSVGGLVGFRSGLKSLLDIPQVKDTSFTLRTHAGGKEQMPDGALEYRD